MAVLTLTRAGLLAIQASAVILLMTGCAGTPAGLAASQPRVAPAQWCERAARDPEEQAQLGLDTTGLVRWDAGRWWLAEWRCPAPAEWVGRREPDAAQLTDPAPRAQAGPLALPPAVRQALPASPAISVVPLGPARRAGAAGP